jgi:hypothetical protein
MSGGVVGAWEKRSRARYGTVGVRSGVAARRGGSRRRRGMGAWLAGAEADDLG